MTRLALTLAVVALVLLPSALAFAHCEVPCGIYGDQTRFHTIHEHIATIEKAIDQINELSAADSPNYNQIVRWVNTKETHATEIQHIVSQYFLTQRIKAGKENYEEHLKMCHAMLTLSMKTKQSLDKENVAKLKEATKAFHDSYMGPEAETHEH
jgi:nickel superoxide dismutase